MRLAIISLRPTDSLSPHLNLTLPRVKFLSSRQPRLQLE